MHDYTNIVTTRYKWLYLHFWISHKSKMSRSADVLQRLTARVSQHHTLMFLASIYSHLPPATSISLSVPKKPHWPIYIFFNYYFSIPACSNKLKAMLSPSLPLLATPLQSVSSQTCELSHTQEAARAPGVVPEFIANEFLHSFILCSIWLCA